MKRVASVTGRLWGHVSVCGRLSGGGFSGVASLEVDGGYGEERLREKDGKEGSSESSLSIVFLWSLIVAEIFFCFQNPSSRITSFKTGEFHLCVWPSRRIFWPC